MAETDLARVAAELYALPATEFTAARNARVRELRANDRALADDVAELRRPSPAAWLVNQLSRHQPAELARLSNLGRELRAAQDALDAPRLASLGRQRRSQIADAVRAAGELAEALGVATSRALLDDVAQTLTAATVDAAAADAVASGRLTRALEAVGTEVDLTGAVAGGAVSAGGAAGESGSAPDPTAPRDEVGDRRAAKRAAEREQRAQALADAETAAGTAAAEAGAAAERMDEARASSARAADHRDALEAELHALEERVADARREASAAARMLQDLEREAERSGRAAERTAAELERLRQDPRGGSAQ